MEGVCKSCGGSNLDEIFSADNQNLSRYGLVEAQALAEKRSLRTINLVSCADCGFIFNQKFLYELVDYSSTEIQESRAFSPRYRDFMELSSVSLMDSLDLSGKSILEIGCGDGFFLGLFKEQSACFGYEPSPEGKIAASRGIDLLGRYYDWKSPPRSQFSLIIMRQVLEHVPEPYEMVKSFTSMLAESPGHLYLEVPNSNKTLAHARFADIYYEHCNYFTSGSLTRLVERAGFRVIYCKEAFDGEVLVLLAEVEKKAQVREALMSAMSQAKANITQMISKNLKVVGWGASGNGPSFLNLCNVDLGQIKYVIDSDPRKQGKFVSGSGHKVVSPTQLEVEPCEVVIVFSQFHKADISKEIREKFPCVQHVVSVEEICTSDLIQTLNIK